MVRHVTTFNIKQFKADIKKANLIIAHRFDYVLANGYCTQTEKTGYFLKARNRPSVNRSKKQSREDPMVKAKLLMMSMMAFHIKPIVYIHHEIDPLSIGIMTIQDGFFILRYLVPTRNEESKKMSQTPFMSTTPIGEDGEEIQEAIIALGDYGVMLNEQTISGYTESINGIFEKN